MDRVLSIAIVIPVYKRECVFSLVAYLCRQTYPYRLYFIIVDNGNEKCLSSRLRRLAAPNCNVIRFERNRGGAGAYHAGMSAAVEGGFDFTWLLDDDALIDELTLPNLVDEYKNLQGRNVRVGALGSMVVDLGTPARVIEVGSTISHFTGRICPRHAKELLSRMGLQTEEVDYTPAVSLLVQREVLVRAGFFSEVFIHWDDVEWQFRLKRLGYRNFATTKSRVRHVRSNGKRAEWLWYYDNRNPVWFLLRHRIYIVPFSIIFRMARALLTLLKGERQAARLMALGVWHAVTGEVLLRDELPVEHRD